MYKELADMLYYTPFSSIIKNELRGFIIIGVRFDEEFNKEKGIPRRVFTSARVRSYGLAPPSIANPLFE